MKLSAFGEKFTGKSGIVELMDDLGQALVENPDMIFMGGGYPSRLLDVESLFQQRLDQYKRCARHAKPTDHDGLTVSYNADGIVYLGCFIHCSE